MNYKRIGRALVCLLLVCCLIVNLSPIRAEATAAGLAGSIASVSAVNVPAGLVLGAAAIALGVAAGTNDDFQRVVDLGVSNVTNWVSNGTAELLRVADSFGNQVFYIAGEFLEDLRQLLFASGAVLERATSTYGTTHNISALGKVWNYTTTKPAWAVLQLSDKGDGTYSGSVRLISDQRFLVYSGDTQLGSSKTESWSNGMYVYQLLFASTVGASSIANAVGVSVVYGSISGSDFEESKNPVTTYLDLTLGQIPTYSLDGTVQDNAFKDYMAKQIRFQNQDSPEDPDGDEANYDWMVPLSLGAAGTVYAMTQAEQWLGSTPSDFSDYETVTDYTIVDTPTVGGFPGILTTPNIGSGTDDDTIPVVPPAIGGGTTTIDPVEGTLSDANAQTFLDSIGSFFSSWFDSILKWLEAIWELIKAGVITLAEAIAAIPAVIAEAITDVLVWAFVPSESYLDAEVTALCSEFPLADSCKNLITAFRDSLFGLGGEPPVIYIHLEDYEGSYNIGGTVPILDMRWYARYKPTVDTLLSSLLWIFFIWRVLVHAPSIISGVAGDVEAFNSGPSGGYFSADNPYRGQFERPARGRFESRRNRK